MEISKTYNSIEPINIGTGVGLSIKTIAETIKEIVNFKGRIIWNKKMSNGAMKKILNNKKMLNIIKWKAKTSIETGINKTVSWYISNYIK